MPVVKKTSASHQDAFSVEISTNGTRWISHITRDLPTRANADTTLERCPSRNQVAFRRFLPHERVGESDRKTAGGCRDGVCLLGNSSSTLRRWPKDHTHIHRPAVVLRLKDFLDTHCSRFPSLWPLIHLMNADFCRVCVLGMHWRCWVPSHWF